MLSINVNKYNIIFSLRGTYNDSFNKTRSLKKTCFVLGFPVIVRSMKNTANKLYTIKHSQELGKAIIGFNQHMFHNGPISSYKQFISNLHSFIKDDSIMNDTTLKSAIALASYPKLKISKTPTNVKKLVTNVTEHFDSSKVKLNIKDTKNDFRPSYADDITIEKKSPWTFSHIDKIDTDIFK